MGWQRALPRVACVAPAAARRHSPRGSALGRRPTRVTPACLHRVRARCAACTRANARCGAARGDGRARFPATSIVAREVYRPHIACYVAASAFVAVACCLLSWPLCHAPLTVSGRRGTPLPIWQSEDGEEMVVVGSIEELERLSGVKVRGCRSGLRVQPPPRPRLRAGVGPAPRECGRHHYPISAREGRAAARGGGV